MNRKSKSNEIELNWRLISDLCLSSFAFFKVDMKNLYKNFFMSLPHLGAESFYLQPQLKLLNYSMNQSDIYWAFDI